MHSPDALSKTRTQYPDGCIIKCAHSNIGLWVHNQNLPVKTSRGYCEMAMKIIEGGMFHVRSTHMTHMHSISVVQGARFWTWLWKCFSCIIWLFSICISDWLKILSSLCQPWVCLSMSNFFLGLMFQFNHKWVISMSHIWIMTHRSV